MNHSTPIADMITEMLQNCIPMEMIIVAVRSMERAVSTRHGVDDTAEKRRAWDREYRRNKRGRTFAHPPDPPDIHPKPPEVGYSALSSLEGTKKHSVEVIKKEKKERGCKLPPDWKPNEHHYDEGAKLGMTRVMVDDRATAMRLWSEANANRSVTTKANWDSAFTGTWIKVQKNAHGNSANRTHQTAGPPQTRDATVIASLARTLEQRRQERAANRPGNEGLSGDDGSAGTPDAEPGASRGNTGTHQQLALLPRANAGRG